MSSTRERLDILALPAYGMLSTFLAGLALGLSNTAICTGTCAPVALVVLLDPSMKTARVALGALLLFLTGRALGYISLGAVAGVLSTRITIADLQRPMGLAFVVLSIALWIQSRARQGTRIGCKTAPLAARWPVAVGALTGLQVCPPLLLSFGLALKAGGVAPAIAHFAGFFAGTSVGLLPLAALPWIAHRLDDAALARLKRTCALVVGFFFFCSGMDHLFPARSATVLNVSQADLKEVMPAAVAFVEAKNPPRFDAFARRGDRLPIGTCYVTSKVSPRHTIGYGGPVSALVGMDRSGTILGVKLLPHQETPIYVARMEDPSYLGQFKGRKVTDKLVLGEEIDAITAATVSAEALCSGVREAGRTIARECLNLIPQEPTEASWAIVAWRWDVVGLALYLVVGVALALLFPGGRTRDVVLVLSVTVLGVALMQFFSIGHLVRMGAWQWPRLPANLKWYMMVGSTLLITVLFGRLYCNYLCPFGALTEILARAVAVKFAPSQRVARFLMPVRFVLLVGTPAAYFILRRHEVIDYEPFSATFALLGGRPPGDQVTLALLVVIFALCIASTRFWCRYLCPAGAAMEVVARCRRDSPGRPASNGGVWGVAPRQHSEGAL